MDFETKAREGYYQKHESEFNADHIAWLISEGVPEKYASKVARVAWDHGHASGFYEVFIVSYDLIEIFTE